MPPVRVLVVDDSAVMRNVVKRFLNIDAGVEVVGTATDGLDALAKIASLRPDVVTLDVEMPGLDGLSALKQIMRKCPVPVVMLSAHTTAGAAATMEALSLGAVDFVAKPARAGELEAMSGELLDKVKTAAGISPGKLVGRLLSRQSVSFTAPGNKPLCRRGIEVVVIGASTGGPAALQTIIPAIPNDFEAAVVVVQHIPAGFSQSLADSLARKSALPVKHAEDGMSVVPGHVLVAPGGFQMSFGRTAEKVNVNLGRGESSRPAHGDFRPSVDGVMAAAAEVYGKRSMGVLLTGMGRDGAKGMAAIKDKEGITIAEAESSCVVFGMPKAAIEAGVVDRIVPLPEIASEMTRLV
ncbi:MAG: chemotaxis response regulator protein-glutamate methylesterase [Peptococcaceae bacterium]|nr:MAG: chemotaxis response regulator protein-glutamate methylesterase [Peptococcaceae bacterium]